jgi:hypothetical protein
MIFDKDNIICYIIVFFVLFLFLKIYSESDVYNLKCIVSDVDGHKYCVRNRDKIKESVDLLARVVNKCQTLVNHTIQKYPDNPNIKKLYKNFNPRRISETLPNSEMSAYSENKGEKIAMCLNKTKNNPNRLIDENTLTYVAIHELSHIMSNVIQHKQEFWDNFKFLLNEAVSINIYNPINYDENPESYCGMTITDNLYFKK